MGFFAEFNAWLDALLATYIGGNTAHIAAALEPAVLTFGVLYVMVWGSCICMGQIEEPLGTGIKRIIVLGSGARRVASAVAVQQRDRRYLLQRAGTAWPRRSSERTTPLPIVDEIIFSGGDAAICLLQKGSVS